METHMDAYARLIVGKDFVRVKTSSVTMAEVGITAERDEYIIRTTKRGAARLAMATGYGTKGGPMQELWQAMQEGEPHRVHVTDYSMNGYETFQSFCEFAQDKTQTYSILRNDSKSVAQTKIQRASLASIMGDTAVPGRVEFGACKASRDKPNDVEEWIEGGGGRGVVADVANLVDHSHLGAVADRPQFIESNANVAVTGGPLHKDKYDALVRVCTGRKVFYLIKDTKVPWKRGSGRFHERLDLVPQPEDFEGEWRMAEVCAGDILYVPGGWGHYVVTEPRTVMTSLWFEAKEEGGVDGGKRRRRARVQCVKEEIDKEEESDEQAILKKALASMVDSGEGGSGSSQGYSV